MSYTPAQARDHIYSTFQATWDDSDKGWRGLVDSQGDDIVLDKQPVVEWDNDIDEEGLSVKEPMVNLYVRHYTSQRQNVGGESRFMYQRKGFVLMRVWVPLDAGLKTADALSYIAKTAFEGKRGLGDGSGIIFRAWRPTETGTAPNRGSFFQVISTIDFEYSEITEA